MAIDLKSIASGVRLKPPKLVLMGVGGVGKTTFASEAPDPIFLMTEDGQGSLDINRFEIREGDPLIRSWQELLDCIGVLVTQEHDFKTVVLDSLDFAEPLLWKHICERDGKSDIEDYGYGKGYLAAEEEARRLLRGLDALRSKGMAVIVICHTDVVRFNDPDTEAYDRYQPRVQKRLAALVHDWTDCLGFARWKTHVVKDDSAGGREIKKDAQKRRRAIGPGDRVMYTEERPAFWAKNRYRLPFELPLSWAAFQKAIADGAKANSSKTPAGNAGSNEEQ